MNITVVAVAMIGIVFPFLFTKNNKWRQVAEFVIGFGILFIGIDMLKDVFAPLKSNPEAVSFVENFVGRGHLSVIAFILAGTLLTILVQSSSAATTITLALLASSVIPFDMACAMVLGENIGTTITANLAAMVGNRHAKRAALFHTLFNLVGVVWMLILFFPFTNFVAHAIGDVYVFFSETFGEGNYQKNSVLKDESLMALALFHTAFNIINVLLLVWFTKYFKRFIVKMLPIKDDQDEEYGLKYISSGLMGTPELSISEAKKELGTFAKHLSKMSTHLQILIFDKPKNREKLIAKIKRREDMTDEMEMEIASFLSKVGESNLSPQSSSDLQGIMRAANEMERIADIIYQMAKEADAMHSMKTLIPKSLSSEINRIFNLIDQQIVFTNDFMGKPLGDVDIDEVYRAENEINAVRKTLQGMIFSELEVGKIPPSVGVAALNQVNSAEKIGDHLVNIAEALGRK